MSDENVPSEHRPLAGKAALVTGAGRGLGRAFAERLAALGCSVAIHGRREHRPSEYGEASTLTEVASAVGKKYTVDTVPILGALQEPEAANRVVAQALERFGRLDVLVHNAGGDIAAAGGKPDPNDAVNISPIDVRAVIDNNLLTTIFVCQAAAKAMMD